MPEIVPVMPSAIAPTTISPSAVAPSAVMPAPVMPTPTAVAPSAVMPTAIAPTKMKIRPFCKEGDVWVRTFTLLEIDAGNFGSYLLEALGHSRARAMFYSTGWRRLHPQGGKHCRNSQNTCGKKHCKCLLSPISHGHWRLLDLTRGVFVSADFITAWCNLSTIFFKRGVAQAVDFAGITNTVAQVLRPQRRGRRASLDRTAEGGCPHMRIAHFQTGGDQG